MTEPRQPETPEQRLAAARTWAGSVEPAPPPVTATSSDMSARVQTVIEAAERAADAIRYDAEEQAQRHLAEAQQKADRLTAERVRLISQLTDDLIEHASVVREHSEKMVSSLEEAIDTVTRRLEEERAAAEGERAAPAAEPWAREAGQAPEAGRTAEPQLDPPVAAATATGTGSGGTSEADEPSDEAPRTEASPEPEAGPEEPSAAALLRATQLAVAGRERDAIGRAIREEFGIDPDPVLARVLG